MCWGDERMGCTFGDIQPVVGQPPAVGAYRQRLARANHMWLGRWWFVSPQADGCAGGRFAPQDAAIKCLTRHLQRAHASLLPAEACKQIFQLCALTFVGT